MPDPDRRQLVGLLTEDPSIVLEEGAQIGHDGQLCNSNEVTRLHHIGLFQCQFESLHRAGNGCRRTGKHRREAICGDARCEHPGTNR